MSKKTGVVIKMWLPVFLWAFIIFSLSSMEQVVASRVFVWDFFIKKIAHVTEYAILFALVFRATKSNWLLTFVLTMIYAASDEFHQSFVPGRTANLLDIGLDFSGANIAAGIIWKLKQIRSKKPKK